MLFGANFAYHLAWLALKHLYEGVTYCVQLHGLKKSCGNMIISSFSDHAFFAIHKESALSYVLSQQGYLVSVTR